MSNIQRFWCYAFWCKQVRLISLIIERNVSFLAFCIFLQLGRIYFYFDMMMICDQSVITIYTISGRFGEKRPHPLCDVRVECSEK